MFKILYGLLILGVILVLLSLIIPRFKNNDIGKIQTLENEFMDYKINESEFQKQYMELVTLKYRIFNVGVGIVTTTISLLLFLLIFKVKNFFEIKKIRSLYNKFLYYLFSNIAQVLIIVGIIGSIIIEDKQYPIYDNSGIAIFGHISISVVILILINISLIPLILLKRTKSGLFDQKFWKKKNKVSDSLWSILLIPFVVTLMLSVYSGMILSIIGCLLAIYVILSFRIEFINTNVS